jgi:hypothetical protein
MLNDRLVHSAWIAACGQASVADISGGAVRTLLAETRHPPETHMALRHDQASAFEPYATLGRIPSVRFVTSCGKVVRAVFRRESRQGIADHVP